MAFLLVMGHGRESHDWNPLAGELLINKTVSQIVIATNSGARSVYIGSVLSIDLQKSSFR